MQKPLSKEEQKWVEGTLEAMSLRELIGQTMQDHAGRLPFKGDDEASLRKYLEQYPVGSFFIGGEVIQKAAGKAEDYRDWAGMLQGISRFPLLFSGDLEFGAGSAVRSLTAFRRSLHLPPPMMKRWLMNTANIPRWKAGRRGSPGRWPRAPICC